MRKRTYTARHGWWVYMYRTQMLQPWWRTDVSDSAFLSFFSVTMCSINSQMMRQHVVDLSPIYTAFSSQETCTDIPPRRLYESYSGASGTVSFRPWSDTRGSSIATTFTQTTSVWTDDVCVNGNAGGAGQECVTGFRPENEALSNHEMFCFVFVFFVWGRWLLVNIMTSHRCWRFLCLWYFLFSYHSASCPFICHDNTSFKAELHQRACNGCRRLSDVSVFPLHAFCCWIFSTTQWRTVSSPPRTSCWIAGNWFRDRH